MSIHVVLLWKNGIVKGFVPNLHDHGEALSKNQERLKCQIKYQLRSIRQIQVLLIAPFKQMSLLLTSN